MYIETTLARLLKLIKHGYEQVNDIRVGKVLYMTVNEPTDEAVDNIITTLSEKLFANTVIEEYSYKVIDEKEQA